MSLCYSSFQHLYRLGTDIYPIIIVAIGVFYIYRAVASLAHNSVTSNNDAINQPRRGRQPPITWVSSLGAFHPLAPQPAEWENTALGRLLRGVDHVVAAVVETAPFLIGELTLLVERARQITLILDFNPYVAPLRTRLRRGLVQVSGLPSALSPRDIQYRYLCPISSLAALFIAFTLFGMSIWLAGLVCSTGCAVIIAGDNLGALDDDEGNRDNALDQGVTSTPDMANIRLIAMLHEQT